MTLTAPPEPPVAAPLTPSSSLKSKRRISLAIASILMVATFAIGAGVTYAVASSQKNKVQDEKTTALAERDAARSSLATAQSDLAAARSDIANFGTAKQLCTTAANSATAFVDQWRNFLNDAMTSSQSDPAAAQHLGQQMMTMSGQAEALESEAKACTSELGG